MDGSVMSARAGRGGAAVGLDQLGRGLLDRRKRRRRTAGPERESDEGG